MNSTPLEDNNGTYAFDYTAGPGNVYGGTNSCKQLNTGIWGMIAADGNADGQVDNTDKDDIWQTGQNNTGYQQADFNLDGLVNENDLNNFWEPNCGEGMQIP